MTVDELKKKVAARLDELMPELIELSDDIFAHPEIRFEEHHAVEVITALLKKHGMEVETGIADLPTAFSAHVPEHRSGPRVGILSEYDALPGLGHACGHNLIGTSGVGAFLALTSIADELDGSVALYGTPAEEGGGGKIVMLEKDVFDGLDATMMTHPVHNITSVDTPFLASTGVTLRFHGKPSHAAAAPTEGINALDALVMTYVGVNGLRQRLTKDVNIAGIVTNGGEAVNIIPAFCELSYSVRAEKWERAMEAAEKVVQVAEGAAAAIGATVETITKKSEYAQTPYYTEDKQNDALKGIFTENLESLGVDVTAHRPEHGMGSTDFANVSMDIPGMHLMLKLDGTDRPPHTVEFAEAAGSKAGHVWLKQAALTMALSTIDILNAEGRLENIKKSFAVAAD